MRLRKVAEPDVAVFFANQQDPVANQMAAFTAPDPTDRRTFAEHWARLLDDDTVLVRTIVVDGRVAGNVLLFWHAGQPEVGYWLGREFWGRGVASSAVAQFLGLVRMRPLYARVAKDNVASVRVLSKAGFVVIGEDRAFAHARGGEVEAYVLRLGDDGG